MEIAKSIFREYDIRGVYPDQVNENAISLIAKAIAIKCDQENVREICIGRDGRLSGESLLKSLEKSLSCYGINIQNIGLVTTPLLYYAAKKNKCKSGVMITGSHNPKNYNGIKLIINDKPVSGNEIYKLLDRNKDKSEVPGKIKFFDIKSNYVEEVKNNIQIDENFRLKVVIDCGNGAAGCIAPKLFSELGCEVIELFTKVDGNFPNHHPDPSKEKNLEQLKSAVQENGADIGFAFDGDGDRVGMITNSGDSVLADHLIMILSEHYLKKKKGAIIFDVKCSSQLPILIENFGGTAIMEKTGHFNIKKAIKKYNAILGGEMSGHIFINHDWYGFDDAIYTAVMLAKVISDTGQPASSVIEQFPKTFTTPELNLDVDDVSKFKMVEKFKEQMKFPDAEFNTIDGVRVSIGSSWGLMRASNTSPKLVFRFEAESKKDLEKIRSLFALNLKNIFPDLRLDFN